ncbi:MAG TPA: hypothetical protein VHD91_02420 [Gaiellaceae bacterium]|nr:hypothetical protein [Gaiellaceae bacterium]
MLESTRTKALPVLSRAVEFSPTLQACCGACRTCVTTNVATVAGAVMAWLLSRVRRGTRRVE